MEADWTHFDEWGDLLWAINKHPETWVTAENKHIHVDDMTERHVRNTLKCILRHAHAGKVWAVSPLTGGLRHYYKGDKQVATATVTKEVQKAKSVFDGVTDIALTLSVEEAKALHAISRHVVPDTVGGKAIASVGKAIVEAGLNREDQDIIWPGQDHLGVIQFRR